MLDLLDIAIMIVFFAGCAALVRGSAHIVGEEQAVLDGPDATPAEGAAAGARLPVAGDRAVSSSAAPGAGETVAAASPPEETDL